MITPRLVRLFLCTSLLCTGCASVAEPACLAPSSASSVTASDLIPRVAILEIVRTIRVDAQHSLEHAIRRLEADYPAGSIDAAIAGLQAQITALSEGIALFTITSDAPLLGVPTAPLIVNEALEVTPSALEDPRCRTTHVSVSWVGPDMLLAQSTSFNRWGQDLGCVSVTAVRAANEWKAEISLRCLTGDDAASTGWTSDGS